MNVTTWTAEADVKLKAYLDRPGYVIPRGLGTEQSACSMAAINLAFTGELTDHIPDCMSEVVGEWILIVQDAMPIAMRNSAEWKGLLPLAAVTGRDREQERLDIMMAWMWGTVLLCWQPRANELGFGAEWQRMCDQRTAVAAEAVDVSVREAGDAVEAARAWEVARAAASAQRAEEVAVSAQRAARIAPVTAEAAGDAAGWAGGAEAQAAVWDAFNPIGLLERLVEVSP